jgi:hypothetical protein
MRNIWFHSLVLLAVQLIWKVLKNFIDCSLLAFSLLNRPTVALCICIKTWWNKRIYSDSNADRMICLLGITSVVGSGDRPGRPLLTSGGGADQTWSAQAN